MATKNPRTDDYISRAEPFARPILKRLRRVVHKADPGIVEEIKWSFPNFTYKGKIICHMASFKEHCAFGLWFSSKLNDPDNILADSQKKGGMGSVGRIRTLDDIPSEDTLIRFIRDSIKMVEEGVKIKPERSVKDQTIKVPADLIMLLKRSRKASRVFDGFSNTHRKEYIQWIEDAKTGITRKKRLETALEWISEGKPRNWKYMKGR